MGTRSGFVVFGANALRPAGAAGLLSLGGGRTRARPVRACPARAALDWPLWDPCPATGACAAFWDLMGLESDLRAQ